MGNRISGKCLYCETHRVSLHRDHIIPKSLGGSDDKSNIQYLCANCHEDKTREEMSEIQKASYQQNPDRRKQAIASGKLGGKATQNTGMTMHERAILGGNARAKKLSPEERSRCSATRKKVSNGSNNN